MSDLELARLYDRVTAWQRQTFPDQTPASILAHMRLELKEIEKAPDDIEERADMALLAVAFADRTGALSLTKRQSLSESWLWGGDTSTMAIAYIATSLDSIEQGREIDLLNLIYYCAFGTKLSRKGFLAAISEKMDKNEARRWPAPSEQVPGQPVLHLRDEAPIDRTDAEVIAALRVELQDSCAKLTRAVEDLAASEELARQLAADNKTLRAAIEVLARGA